MMLVLPILVCFVPLILLFCILCFGFKLKATHLLVSLLAGLICVLPVSVIQYFAGMAPFFTNQNLLSVLLKSLVLYGLIEELCKLIMILFIPGTKNTNTSGARDFLLLSFFFGLSLGCFESVIYFLDHLQKSTSIGGELLYRPVFVRMFTSDLLHLFTAGLIGLYMFEKRRPEGEGHFFLVILAVLIHGVYDFFAGFSNSFSYFSLAVILFAAIECRVKYTLYNSKGK